MNILVIETTGATASAAIINEQGIAAQTYSDETLNHLSFLMPLISEALEKADMKVSDIDVVAASEGPGSFTGIRIGVSSARALAQALNLPCMSIPTLQTFLYNLDDNNGNFMSDKYENVVFCPMFDARRSQVYGGAYAWKKTADAIDNIWEVVEGKAYSLEEFLNAIESKIKEENSINRIIFFGDGIKSYGAQIESWKETSLNDNIQVEFAEEAVRYQNAVSGAKLAMKLYSEENLCTYNELKPNYMRQAEAQRKLEEAKAAEKRG